MDLKPIAILMFLVVCAYAEEDALTFMTDIIEGTKQYVHFEGQGKLKCILKNKSLQGKLMLYKNGIEIKAGEEGLENLENPAGEKYAQVTINGSDRSPRTYTCKLVHDGKTVVEKTATMTITGENKLDVFLTSSVEGTLIKDDVSSVNAYCLSGGGVEGMVHNPLVLSHNDDVLFDNGIMRSGVKEKYNITHLGFGGYLEANIYNGVRFNDVSQLLGTLKCNRKEHSTEIVFTNKEDVGSIEMKLLKNGEQKGSIQREANQPAPGVKTLRTLPIGKFLFECEAAGGYPAPVVTLMKNGNPIKAETKGDGKYHANIDLTTTDQYLACSVEVSRMKTKYVMKFKIDVVEDPLPVECTTISRKTSLIRSCTVGSETRPTSCGKVFYQVSWSKSGKSYRLDHKENKGNLTWTCAVHNKNHLKVDVILNSAKEGRTFVLYYGDENKTERLNEYVQKPNTGGQVDPGSAGHLVPFGKMVLTILASAVFFIFRKI